MEPTGTARASGTTRNTGAAGPGRANRSAGTCRGLTGANFAFNNVAQPFTGLAYQLELTKHFVQGSYAHIATVELESPAFFQGDTFYRWDCQMRDAGGNVIGAAVQANPVGTSDPGQGTLTMTGGTVIGANGGDVTIRSGTSNGGGEKLGVQMLTFQVGGFF